MNKTTALEVSARFGDDGAVFKTPEGVSLQDECIRHGAWIEYGRCENDDDDGNSTYRCVSSRDIYDAVRYEFDDGSAIVVAGDAWDIEGAEPFSWAGA